MKVALIVVLLMAVAGLAGLVTAALVEPVERAIEGVFAFPRLVVARVKAAWAALLGR